MLASGPRRPFFSTRTFGGSRLRNLQSKGRLFIVHHAPKRPNGFDVDFKNIWVQQRDATVAEVLDSQHGRQRVH